MVAENTESSRLLRRVRYLLGFFVLGLVLSGLTAFPLGWETAVLHRLFGQGTFVDGLWPAMAWWMSRVHEGVADTQGRYPFIFYGTDWLAFAHIVIAVAFLGPIRDPLRNVWVIQFGMIACVLLIPLALICGPIRGIPLFWRLGDCLFGVVGFIPLWHAYRYTRELAVLQTALRI
jgi:hypothetical protein